MAPRGSSAQLMLAGVMLLLVHHAWRQSTTDGEMRSLRKRVSKLERRTRVQLVELSNATAAAVAASQAAAVASAATAAVTEAAVAARRGVPVAPSTLAILAKAGASAETPPPPPPPPPPSASSGPPAVPASATTGAAHANPADAFTRVISLPKYPAPRFSVGYVDPAVDFSGTGKETLAELNSATPFTRSGGRTSEADAMRAASRAAEKKWHFGRDNCTVVLPSFELEPYSVLGRARLDLLEKMTMLGRHVSRSGAACPPQPRTKLFAFGVERAEVVRSLAWLAREYPIRFDDAYVWGISSAGPDQIPPNLPLRFIGAGIASERDSPAGCDGVAPKGAAGECSEVDVAAQLAALAKPEDFVVVRIDGGDLTYDAVDRLARAGVAPLIDEIFIRFKGGGFFHEYVQINGEWQVINEPPPPRNQLQKVYFEWKDLVSSVHPWPG